MDVLTLTNEPLSLEQIVSVIAIAVGLVFGYAAASKLVDVTGLVSAIRGYSNLPRQLASLAAGVLLAGETLIALAHITGTAFRFLVPGTLVLLSIFFAVVARLLKRGDSRPCLCFGVHRDEPADVLSLVRIAILWLAEGLLYLLLTINDDLMAARAESVYYDIELFFLAALVVTLVSWCFTFPKFHRAWRIVRS
jgi:hypothetical protein